MLRLALHLAAIASRLLAPVLLLEALVLLGGRRLTGMPILLWLVLLNGLFLSAEPLLVTSSILSRPSLLPEAILLAVSGILRAAAVRSRTLKLPRRAVLAMGADMADTIIPAPTSVGRRTAWRRA